MKEDSRAGLHVSLTVNAVRATVFLYDIVTLPIYTLLQRPWRSWASTGECVAQQLDPDDPYSPTIRVKNIHPDPLEGVTTAPEMFQRFIEQHADRQCMGTREVLSWKLETQPDGKVFRKLRLGKYNWITYREMGQRVNQLGGSLVALGVQPRELIVLFAETRMEWMLMAQACFSVNVPVVTLFSTLGEEGLVHGICEAGSRFLFTSIDLLPRIKKLLPQLPHITHVICMEGVGSMEDHCLGDRVKLISFYDFYKMGENVPKSDRPAPPTKDDLAMIMYTSGSSGKAKGVMYAQKHIVYNVSTVHGQRCPFENTDSFPAYLPLAHIFELSVENMILLHGGRIGYSSPFTLTGKSTGIIEGEKGDLMTLGSTCLIAVPLVLDRIKKSIQEVIDKKSPLTVALFNFAYKYKSKWYRRGYDTPIADRLIFKKIKDQLCPELRLVATGGAPLCPETLEFVRICLGLHLVQAYGQTESSGMGTFTNHLDRTSGHIGPPMTTVQIRMVDWKEGGYSVRDQPNPRGEIVIGGRVITNGYFKNEELTKEVFVEEDGVRWVYTGDIGERLPNGNYRLIDRKKDLVKLQYGEYISLGKVEAVLKTSPLVDNICALGDSYMTYLVAIILPNRDQLLKLARELDRPEGMTFAELCHDHLVCSEVAAMLRAHGIKCGLLKNEIPGKITLCPDEWLPDSGLVTPGMKVRRKPIENYYRAAIDEMYGRDRINTKGS